jgi:hypothetical protein
MPAAPAEPAGGISPRLVLASPANGGVRFVHDLFGKPLHTPHQVRGRLFRIMRMPPSHLRARPIEGLMIGGIEIVRIEGADVRQQRLGETTTLDLVVGQRALQVLVQGTQ